MARNCTYLGAVESVRRAPHVRIPDNIVGRPDITGQRHSNFEHFALAHRLQSAHGMSRPRQIVPQQFYMLTRRCTQRQMLMRPDAETTNAFIYCLALAALRFSIDVIFTLAEANHHHTLFYDRYGNASAFAEYFHKLFARSQNALRGRFENFWAAEECCITRLLDPDTVIAKVVYAATNPVKDLLVERVHHWPGANAYSAFMNGHSLRATRPRHFFRKTGGLPDTIELKLEIPEQLGDVESVRERVRAGVSAIEEATKNDRLQSGKKILGRRGVLAQSWRATPGSIEQRGTLRPRFAGRPAVCVAALAAYRSFLHAYRRARQLLLAGADAVFPVGTYKLARTMNVRVEAKPPAEDAFLWWPSFVSDPLGVELNALRSGYSSPA